MFFCLRDLRSELQIKSGPLPFAYQIVPYCRFGNNFYQLLNAINICHFTRAKYIFIRRGFALISHNANTTTGISILVERSPLIRNDQILIGQFYHIKATCVFAARQRAAEAIRHVYWEMAQSFTVDENDIYLHVRSGDVMTNGRRGVHAKYAQPPCRFYTEAVMMHGNMSNMVLATDGGANPCIQILESLGAKMLRGSPRDTLLQMIQARRFAMARSTFSNSALILSKHLRDGKFYSFDIPDRLPAPHWDCVATDLYRTQVLSFWRSDVYQLRLMKESGCKHWNYYSD
jgi:hypothetical protein